MSVARTNPVESQHGVDVLEAIHSEDRSVTDWLTRINESFAKLVPSEYGATAVLLERGRHRYYLRASVTTGVYSTAMLDGAIRSAPRRYWDAFFWDPQFVGTIESTERRLSGADGNLHGPTLQSMGATDGIALLGKASRKWCVAATTNTRDTIRLQPAERLLLARVALHLEMGLALRLTPESMVAVVHPSGKLEAIEQPPVGAAERWAAHARAVETVRVHRQAVETWTALCSGRYGFVERIDTDGKRYYVVLDCPPHHWRDRKLSPRQAQVLELSARGLTGKLVAYALGIAPREVSAALSGAALRLGVGTRLDAIRLAALSLGLHQEADTSQLTETERLVLTCIQRGWSNAAIARHRDCSPRTVANQVASILRKTHAVSRRELVVLPLDRSHQ